MSGPPRLDDPGRRRVAIAQRVADTHRGIDDASLLSFVSGSTVDNLADDRSDVDMSVVFAALPDEPVLRAACRSVGSDWIWSLGAWAEGAVVVAFHVDGIEVQTGYSSQAQLTAEIDQVLVAHDPDTPNHKLAEGVAKALPLAGAAAFAALQTRVAVFPPALGRRWCGMGWPRRRRGARSRRSSTATPGCGAARSRSMPATAFS